LCGFIYFHCITAPHIHDGDSPIGDPESDTVT
jgi:hypothetical protein